MACPCTLCQIETHVLRLPSEKKCLRRWECSEGSLLLFFLRQMDNLTERMNRAMEEMLRHFISPIKGDWVAALPMLEFAYDIYFNATVH
jgi:hypothetical protein